MRVVATRVAARLFEVAGSGRVLGGSGGAFYASVGDDAVAVTARGVPLMPLGASVGIEHLPPVTPGAPAALAHGVLRAGEVTVGLAGAPSWDPRVPAGSVAAAARRGAEVLNALGDVSPEVDAADLFAAVADHDAMGAAAATADLIGRGAGLTPEGDDVVGGVAAALWSAGALDRRWRAALVPDDVAARTGTLSAGLLRAAARGEVVEPLGVVLDPAAPVERWRPALARLVRIGHGTGRAWAYGAARAAVALERRTTKEEIER